jgi:hypothetical protein
MKTKALCAFLMLIVMTVAWNVGFSNNNNWPPGKEMPKTEKMITINNFCPVMQVQIEQPAMVIMPAYQFTVTTVSIDVQNDNGYTYVLPLKEAEYSGNNMSAVVEVQCRSGVMTEIANYNLTATNNKTCKLTYPNS